MTYIITGGGSGIGQALSWRLAAQDEQVIIIGRREEALAVTCARFPEKISAISADLSQEAGRKKVVMALQSVQNLTIKALIHGAGIVDPVVSLAHVTIDAWRAIQSTNVEAPLFLTQQLLPWLKSGRLLMISTQVAHVAQLFMGPYCVSKAALFMLTQCLNLDLHALDINVTSMTPGIVDTAMFRSLAVNPAFSEVQHQFYQNVIKSNIWIQPDVAACFIQWLLCSLDKTAFSSQEWDIYDTSHHHHWVRGFVAPQAPGFA
jgi:NAD(P)-dependent dehydrogenase (short-subunit alcohol dehydrogenase family)